PASLSTLGPPLANVTTLSSPETNPGPVGTTTARPAATLLRIQVPPTIGATANRGHRVRRSIDQLSIPSPERRVAPGVQYRQPATPSQTALQDSLRLLSEQRPAKVSLQPDSDSDSGT